MAATRTHTVKLTERELRLILAALDLERAASKPSYGAGVDKLYTRLLQLDTRK